MAQWIFVMSQLSTMIGTLKICYVTMKHYSIIIKKSKGTLEVHVATDHHCDINVKGELRYYNAIS